MVWIPIAFGAVAFLYALAGFGGGSTYIALLVIAGLPLAVIPVISLTCNLIVSGQGACQLSRRGHIQWRMLVPLLLGSMPAAFLGGAWQLSGEVFLWVLTVTLTAAGVALLWRPVPETSNRQNRTAKYSTTLLLGSVLGLVSGLSGIGGGIFLAPVLHLLRWDTARAISSAAAVFIALNSLAGLVGQLTKGLGRLGEVPAFLLWACPVAVLIGGVVGSHQLATKLSSDRIRRVTAIVVLLVALRLWLRLLVGS
ncbi:MAG: sulfite exporter TauE/SafE family protein [Verrucomicrobiota bacterium]